MKALSGAIAAPFPYFGGKSGAVEKVWAAFGPVSNYVEPFAGSAAMLLGAPPGKRVETINDFDGFVANFWRAIAHGPDAVAHAADWPCNEVDLFARHSWLVRQRASLTERLHADPHWYDAKIAGWWCWGAPIERVCAASGIDVAVLRDAPEDNLAELLTAWYRNHLSAGGEPDPVYADLIAEVRAEDAAGQPYSHQPGRA